MNGATGAGQVRARPATFGDAGGARHADPVRPALVMADNQGASSREVFRPLDPNLHGEIADVLADLARRDPDVLAAVEDVDRTLIWEAMREDPLARLSRSAQQARFYARLKGVA